MMSIPISEQDIEVAREMIRSWEAVNADGTNDSDDAAGIVGFLEGLLNSAAPADGRIPLTAENPEHKVELDTPSGELHLSAHLDPKGGQAVVVWIDTPQWEPTPQRLRVNVNDGAVFNYPDAVNSYGEQPEEPQPPSPFQLIGFTDAYCRCQAHDYEHNACATGCGCVA